MFAYLNSIDMWYAIDNQVLVESEFDTNILHGIVWYKEATFTSKIKPGGKDNNTLKNSASV